MYVLVLNHLSNMLFSHATVCTIAILCHPCLFSSFLFFSVIPLFIMSHNANDPKVGLAVPSSDGKEALRVASSNAAKNTRLTDIKKDC